MPEFDKSTSYLFKEKVNKLKTFVQNIIYKEKYFIERVKMQRML